MRPKSRGKDKSNKGEEGKKEGKNCPMHFLVLALWSLVTHNALQCLSLGIVSRKLALGTSLKERHGIYMYRNGNSTKFVHLYIQLASPEGEEKKESERSMMLFLWLLLYNFFALGVQTMDALFRLANYTVFAYIYVYSCFPRWSVGIRCAFFLSISDWSCPRAGLRRNTYTIIIPMWEPCWLWWWFTIVKSTKESFGINFFRFRLCKSRLEVH